ncbi:lipopolysaccharide biosynthesis protein [Mycolicibacterium gilvum]|uniref:Membrane protein involved in the export of O-antigen and teichoic acid n=1 Tax=Mycolicibacterium gilvum TaxID=1804 RepID=A0A378SSH5_9MYCO|nr:oligosaccharide flippase family protein [Mycolicibacterium gilvum]MCV7055883.1 oligosaccharide flippase family protein [Mycolicibacterium gilvum]STZ45720.1 membrane protein involved in the export of O-antigen and teichoic acid [Mycolicibacterium gilvum]
MPPSFIRNTMLGFGSGAAVALAGFIGNAITARLLGPDDLGVLAYVVFCVTIGSMVAGLGIGIVQQRFIPKLRAAGDDDEADGLIGATTRLSILAAVVGTLLLFAYLYWPGREATDAGSESSRDIVIAVALIWFILWRMAEVYQFYLRGEQRFGELARLSAVSALIKLVVITAGAWFFGIPGALAGYVAGNLLPAARIGRLLRIKPKVSPSLRQEVTRFALTSWATAVLGGLVFGRTEVLFLEHYTGLEAVGFFAAAVTVAEMAVQLPPLLLSALLPRFSEQHGLGAREDMHRLYRTMTALIAMVIVPLCLGLAALAPVLVPLLFGSAFENSVPVASVLLIAAAISSLGVTTFYLLQSIGKTGFLLMSNGIGLLGTLALGFLLVPRFGLMGAAWSRGIVQVTVVLIETFYVTRRLNVSPPYRALAAIALAAVAQAGVAYGIVLGWGGIASLWIAIPAAVLTFLVAIRLLAVIPMVAPGIPARLIDRAPSRLRPLVSGLMMLLVPADRRGP